MRYEICCIGHITLDKVVTPKATVFMPGGTSFYFSNAVANMDVRYALVGTGREPLTAEETALLGPDAERLPLFG